MLEDSADDESQLPEPGEDFGSGTDYVGSGEGGESGMHDMKDLHKLVEEYLQATCVDGADLRYFQDALGRYGPWKNLTELVIGVWALIERPSRKSLQKLLDLLRFVDEAGSRFDPRHVRTQVRRTPHRSDANASAAASCF